MIGVIGKTGLVGSAICDYFNHHGYEVCGINRSNYQACIGHSFEILINANGTGHKGQANRDPQKDFELNVNSTLRYLFDFKYDVFVQMSTIDVYHSPSVQAQTQEEIEIQGNQLSPYGLHRYIAEQLVQKYCAHWLVLRLGGLVGPGLSKNPIFDWANGRNLFVSPQSCLTFINTKSIAVIVETLIKHNVQNQILNAVACDSICLQTLPSVFDIPLCLPDNSAELPRQDYIIASEKLQKYCSLGSSEDYIRDYLENDIT